LGLRTFLITTPQNPREMKKEEPARMFDALTKKKTSYFSLVEG